jgi:alkaline phosphatase D
VLKAKYDSLGVKPEFRKLKSGTRILATWDDHDFGWNDSGKYYPFKEESKTIFLDFFNEPFHSERRKHEGIYTSYVFGNKGKRVQVILLDVRTFRSDLLKHEASAEPNEKFFYPLDYDPHVAADSQLLGEAQWQWLEKELSKPAEIRIIGSGSQFGISYNGYEAWANFPHEQKRMLELIRKTKAEGVLFITGDVHYGEISKLIHEGLYPIYDITSSGITSTWYFAAPNDNRIEGPVMENHFGMISIDWSKKDPVIKMEIIDVTGNHRVEYSIRRSDLSFRPVNKKGATAPLQ